jgi:predicted DNA binding CopG/RHH family protein
MDMKKKRSKKNPQENPNQLNFEFFKKETSIDVHIPKSATTVFNTHFTTTKRLAIRLAES